MSGEENRDLVICNNCQWAASLLRGSEGYAVCPICGNSSLDTVPVNDYESYTMDVRDKTVDIQFNKE